MLLRARLSAFADQAAEPRAGLPGVRAQYVAGSRYKPTIIRIDIKLWESNHRGTLRKRDFTNKKPGSRSCRVPFDQTGV